MRSGFREVQMISMPKVSEFVDGIFRKVNILGVDVCDVSKRDLLRWVVARAKTKVPTFITYVNADCMNQVYGDKEYFNILKSADLVYPDGIGVVMAGRFLAGVNLVKITGRDWIVDFFKLCASEHLRIYVLAGKPGVSENAKKRLVTDIPGLNIVGVSHGYLDDVTSQYVADEINRLRVDVLMIGMGAPKQEKWVHKHRQELDVPVIWTVGAGFDYFAGVEVPVPHFLNRLGLEWFWRFLVDPMGKWKRYLWGVPLFVFRVLRAKLGK